jgi:hypothetical protein
VKRERERERERAREKLAAWSNIHQRRSETRTAGPLASRSSQPWCGALPALCGGERRWEHGRHAAKK